MGEWRWWWGQLEIPDVTRSNLSLTVMRWVTSGDGQQLSASWWICAHSPSPPLSFALPTPSRPRHGRIRPDQPDEYRISSPCPRRRNWSGLRDESGRVFGIWLAAGRPAAEWKVNSGRPRPGKMGQDHLSSALECSDVGVCACRANPALADEIINVTR